MAAARKAEAKPWRGGPTPLYWTVQMDARLRRAFAEGLSAEAAGASLGVGGTLARRRADALGIQRRRPAPPPGPARDRAVAMIRDGASYNQAALETGASPSAIGRWAKAAGVAYAPRECPHVACANRRWAMPGQRERFAEVGRRLMADPAHKAAMSAGAREAAAERRRDRPPPALKPGRDTTEGRRAQWEARNPGLAHLTPEQALDYRHLRRVKHLSGNEALAVIADAAARTIRKAA